MANIYRQNSTAILSSATDLANQSAQRRAQYQNALAKQKFYSAKQQGAKKMYDLTSEATDLAFAADMTNRVFDFANDLISAGSKIYSLIEDQQTVTANNTLTDYANQLENALNMSIYNGTTKFVEDDSGNLVMQIDPEVQQQYESFLQQIDNSSLMKSVKQKASGVLQANWSNLQNGAMSSLLQTAYSDREAAYSANLANAIANDAAMLAANDGNLPEGSTFSGISIIHGRTDWNEKRKKTEDLNYSRQVWVEYGKQKASSLATGRGGLLAAYDFAYSMPGLLEGERQAIVQSATTTLTQRITAVEGLADNVMAQVFLSNDGSVPQDAYELVANQLSGEAPEIISAAIEQMRTTQTEAVTSVFSTQLSNDTVNGYEELLTTYNGLASGSYDQYFYNIPQTKSAVMASYASAIAKEEDNLASALGTTKKEIQDADKQVLSSYKTQVDYYMAQFGAGMSGAEVIAAIGTAGEAAAEQLQLHDSFLSMQTTRIEAVRKIGEDYLPTAWKNAADDAIDILLDTVKLSGSDLTEEQQLESANLTNYALGLVADMYYESKEGNVTLDDITSTIYGLKDAIALTCLTPGKQNPRVKDQDGYQFTGASAAFNDAVKTNTLYQQTVNLAYMDDGQQAVDELSGVVSQGYVKYISDEVRQSFENMCRVFSPHMAKAAGVEESELIVAPTFIDGQLYLTPTYTVIRADGTVDSYRINGEYITRYEEGEYRTFGRMSVDADDFTYSNNLANIVGPEATNITKESVDNTRSRSQALSDQPPAARGDSLEWALSSLSTSSMDEVIRNAGSRDKAEKLVEQILSDTSNVPKAQIRTWRERLRGQLEEKIKEIYG